MNVEHMLQGMWTDVEKVLAHDTREDEDRRHKAGEFHFIPFAIDRFADQLVRAQMAASVNHSPGDSLTFIDAGCGIGSKVLAAQKIGGDYYQNMLAFGIEKETKYVEAARTLLGVSLGEEIARKRIISGDAIKHNYGDYDIIYFYRPLSDPEKQVKLEERIVSTSKKGAIIIANGGQSHHFGWGQPNKTKVREIYDRTLFIRI